MSVHSNLVANRVDAKRRIHDKPAVNGDLLLDDEMLRLFPGTIS
jgi:hypothetical protein